MGTSKGHAHVCGTKICHLHMLQYHMYMYIDVKALQLLTMIQMDNHKSLETIFWQWMCFRQYGRYT